MNWIDFWHDISNLIERHYLLRHPFYEDWTSGKLTRADISEYAAEYYHQVASFPACLKEFAATLPAGELKHAVLQNLWDEVGMEGGENRAHNLLWLDFAVAAGAVAGNVFERTPIPEIQELIGTFQHFARSGEPAQALAAFYVYESQVPGIARAKGRTLQSKYGFDEGACKYFTVHMAADEVHSRVWRDHLRKHLNEDPGAAWGSLIAAEQAALALWRALDGIEGRRALRSPTLSGLQSN
jgi:pyrroloquinoline-quinone synthase